jgi:hypothetical protein
VVQVTEPVDDVALNWWFGLFLQTICELGPPFTTGAGLTVTTIVWVSAKQFPFPVVVRSIVKLPAEISAALGTYVVFKDVLLGVKLPVPELPHMPPLATVTEPLSDTFGLFAQIVWLAPANAVGPGLMLTCSVALCAAQPPLFVEVSVKVATPAVICEALGTNVPVRLFGVKVPPTADQVPEPVVEVPFNVTLALFAHTVGAGPALTVAGIVTRTFTTATVLVQPATVAVTEYCPVAVVEAFGMVLF